MVVGLPVRGALHCDARTLAYLAKKNSHDHMATEIYTGPPLGNLVTPPNFTPLLLVRDQVIFLGCNFAVPSVENVFGFQPFGVLGFGPNGKYRHYQYRSADEEDHAALHE
jgi:hypothetical protein